MTKEEHNIVDEIKDQYRSKAYRFFKHDMGNILQVEQGYRELINSLEEEIDETEDTEEIMEKAQQIREHQKVLEESQERSRAIREPLQKIYRNPGLQEIDFRELLQQSIDSLRPQIEETGNSVAVNWMAEDYRIENYMVLERAVYNIIDNELEHGDQDVEIDVFGSGENLFLSVDGSYNGDINNIYSEEFEKATRGSELVRETINDLGVDLYNTGDSYEIRIPRDLREDNQA